jgi:hypothetical protein
VTWPDVFTAVAAISAIATRSGPDASARVLGVYLDGLPRAARTGPLGGEEPGERRALASVIRWPTELDRPDSRPGYAQRGWRCGTALVTVPVRAERHG